MLKEERSPYQGNDLIGPMQISLMEVSIRNLPEMAKIRLRPKGRRVTLNLTSDIETFPNPGSFKSKTSWVWKITTIHPCCNCLGLWMPSLCTFASGISALAIKIQYKS